ncbi:MAG: sporulation integral membrane protein YtvI [Lachnospiraceae bacterium]|nr:sporulation integral membrane protein YtvI [Lachnospiraceae bacterium]
MDDQDLVKTEQQKAFLIKFCYWGSVALCVYAVLKYLFPVLFPFVLAFGIAYILNNPVCRMAGGKRWKRTIASILLSVTFFVIAGGLAICLGVWLCSGIKQIVLFLPVVFQDFLLPFLEDAFAWIEEVFGKVDISTLELLEGGFESILKSLGEGFAAFSNTVLSSAARAAASVPGIFMKTVITIIATIFLTIDFEKVNGFILRQISEKQKVILHEARGYFGGTLLKCIASYGVIFLITFLELWVGLSMIKIPYSATIALVIAVLDILPVLGTGSVLIPWGIFAALNADFKMAAGVLILYLVITIIRNIIEPRLVGKQVGLHPVLTLAGMLLGLKFAGFAGMLGVPFLLAFIKRLNDKRIIHLLH